MIIEDRSIDLWAYNIETLLAEKLETIMARAEANTRMRDFYDIYVLLQYEGDKIDEVILKEAFIATCRRRGSETKILNFADIINRVHNSDKMKLQWDNYRRDNYYVGELSWAEVCDSVKKLEAIISLPVL